MKKEIHIFLTAVMFFTRIPVPKNIDHSSNMLQKSARYFSWVGILVGGIGAAVFILAAVVFSPTLSLAFSILATILTTGAFHEDGFADSCDAFGGGWTKEKILSIMKDSRLGTYGVIGLILMLSFKFLALLELINILPANQFVWMMIAAHSSSRLMAVSVKQQYRYVQDMDVSKTKPQTTDKLTPVEYLIALTGGCIAFLMLPLSFLLVFIPVCIARLYAGWYFKKWIGGYTGDCLGATQQVCEIVFYLGILIISHYL